MQQLGLLYSGGKDSSLAAYLLNQMGFEVKLICASFGVNDDWKYAKQSAEALDFDFQVLKLERDILNEAQKIVKRNRYPRYAITHIHKKALIAAAKNYKVLSDGTRRDDKAPFLSLQDYRALEDGFGVEYLPVLRGFGHKTINRLCRELFEIEEDESSKINKGDYEGELRTHLENEGLNIQEIFPPHTQTRVISKRTNYVKGDEGKKD